MTIKDIDATAPKGPQSVGDGDNQIRGLKSDIRGSWPAFASASPGDDICNKTGPEIDDAVDNRLTAFNGRTATDVVPASGDYDADQVDETAARIWLSPAERSKLSGVASGATDGLNGTEVIADLTDVSTSGASAEQVLAYGSSGDWENHYFEKHIASFTNVGAVIGETAAIPSSPPARRIQLLVHQVSTTTTNSYVTLQMGNSASYTMSSEGSMISVSPSGQEGIYRPASDIGVYLALQTSNPVPTYTGVVDIWRMDGTDRWLVKSMLMPDESSVGYISTGFITVSGGVNRLRVTCISGTFTGGQVDVRVTQ